MENIEYKYELTSEGERIMAKGGIREVQACIARQAQTFYSRLKQQNPIVAELFRLDLTATLADPQSPIWQMENQPGGTGFCIISAIKRGEGDT